MLVLRAWHGLQGLIRSESESAYRSPFFPQNKHTILVGPVLAQVLKQLPVLSLISETLIRVIRVVCRMNCKR
jgi:hypothetical protein